MDYALTFLIAVHSIGLGLSTRPSGQIGPLGSLGSKGPEGPSGLVGQQGRLGLKGTQGPPGTQGPTGLSGSQGPIGSTRRGLQGPTGPEFPQSRGLRAPDVINYSLLTKVTGTSARILFQTTCAIVFFIEAMPEDPNYGVPANFRTFTFIPRLAYAYSGPELAREMSLQAQNERWPLTVTFQNNAFYFSSPYYFRFTDREFSLTDTIIGGRYVGARYGECVRFLNHLNIEAEQFISYQPPYNAGQAFNFLVGLPITTYVGFDAVPAAPAGYNLGLNINNLLLDFLWPSSTALSYGIFLQTTLGNVQNWDQVPKTNTVFETYTFTDLEVGTSFFAGVSSISRYDESEPFMTTTPILIPIPGPSVFDALAGSVKNTMLTTVNINEYTTLISNASNSWPVGLTFEKITSINIKFYASITTGFPSDARISFGQTGPLLYYMYWRAVQRIPGDLSNASTYPVAFASVTNSPYGTKGPVSPPLPYDDLFISNPQHLASLFTTDGTTLIARPPDLTLFVGYPGSQLQFNNGVDVVEKFEIFYNP